MVRSSSCVSASSLDASADASSEDALTQEELRTIVNESSGLIPRRHRNMLVNILDLEQVTVNDIMVPRNEIYGIDLKMMTRRY